MCNKEKLIELLDEVQVCGEDFNDYELYGVRYPCTVSNQYVADYLIDNGVTLDEKLASSSKYLASSMWIPVTERLPKKDVPVLGMAKRNPFAKWMPMVVEWVGNGWVCLVNDQYMECTHWMPLPEPPKGESK